MSAAPGCGAGTEETPAPQNPSQPQPKPGGYTPPSGGGGGGGAYSGETDRSKLPDSFKYYGPNGLWWKWDDSQRLGRDTWIFYTGGTQKFYHILARFGGQFGISVDFFRLLDSKRRPDRFKTIGLINEPNFVQAGDNETDQWGFRVDKWKGDPIAGAYPVNAQWYGEPTGIIGLRKFPNPDFTDAMKTAWLKDPKGSAKKYFDSPGTVQGPYIVGITCALCHVAFDPLNPPKDTANPRWENLAANIGNQYLREGDLFFGAGRVVAGDANPGPNYKNDPYDTEGLGESSFLYQYGHTQQPGTSETSRFSYDFINNPNTINQIINLGGRAAFDETTGTGHRVLTPHVLKDGSDSIGVQGALLRVFINIGSEGDYWADHLWNPATGSPQHPFSIAEVKGEVPPERLKESCCAKYPELGVAWHETERRVPFLLSYLASYTPYPLKELKDKNGKPYVTSDAEQLKRGATVYADTCARCHSNKQPFYPLTSDADRQRYYRNVVLSDDFLAGNTLTDDVRYPVNEPGFGVNAARALATNAIDNDIWADFSSEEYKALLPLRFMSFTNPVNQLDPSKFGTDPIVTEFIAPGGGRGYYRTAALTSMWATAPYLHNNSIGRDPVDANGMLDPKYATVEGRLELFDVAIDQLLNPEKRPLKIKVTSTDSSLLDGMPGVRDRLATILRTLAKERTEELFLDVVDAGGAPTSNCPTSTTRSSRS